MCLGHEVAPVEVTWRKTTSLVVLFHLHTYSFLYVIVRVLYVLSLWRKKNQNT